MLPLSPFPTRSLSALNAVAQALLFPAAFTLNHLLDLRPTTADRRRRPRCVDIPSRVLLGSVLTVLLALTIPAAFLGLLLWLPVQTKRKELTYSYSASASADPVTPWELRHSRDFTFVSANVCLLPSGLAKFSNLGQTESRARFLARCLVPEGATDRQPLLGGGETAAYGGACRAGGGQNEDKGAAMEIPWDPKEGVWITPKEPPMGAPKEGVCVTPRAPKDNQRDAVIDVPRDGVKDTPKDPTMETPRDPTTHSPRDGVWVTSEDPTVDTPMDGDTPWHELRATPRDNDTLRGNATPWDPARATPRDTTTPWDPTRATPRDNGTPMGNTTPRDPTKEDPPMDDDDTPKDDATPWEPGGATPRDRDPLPPRPPTRLGSFPQLWERFPPAADFVCLQEVFDPAAEALLLRQLGLRYPHVLHGVGAGGIRAGGLKVLGSGLMVAARYPIVAASFYCYPNGAREDAMAAKGLLCIQVLLGSLCGRRVLGYLSCTHLQAPEGDGSIRCEQLSLALRWGRHFRAEHEQSGDVVGFDVLCGDLNFDNCSGVASPEQHHELFRHYCDPCRLGQRRDAPWAMGTLLDYLKIYDDPINSPERMKRTLSDPAGRRRFLAGPLVCGPRCQPQPHGDPDGDGPHGDPEPTEWRGRRVDYILYRERGATMSTEVSALGFVTALAARSDHLPIALTLSVRPTSGGGGPDPQVPPPPP